jgi:hypothetical protein|tara:strand:- start:645 stop:881 length:237 start_codon:yes stop_codon:yes gene_type:complete
LLFYRSNTKASGCPYYFNSTTQEYRWEDPRIVEAFAPEGKGYGEGREWWDGQLEGGEQALALLSGALMIMMFFMISYD